MGELNQRGGKNRQLGFLILQSIQNNALGRRPRTLLIFANPLGNAAGDTIIATQHVKYLRSIPENEIFVWTTNGEIWKAVEGDEIKTFIAIDNLTLKNYFDFIILDWVNPGRDFFAFLKKSNAIVLSWESRTLNPKFYIPGSGAFTVLMDFNHNHPSRIGDLYEELGWSSHPKLRNDLRRDFIYFNPYASTAKKSFSMSLAISLIEAIDQLLPVNFDIGIGPRPRILSQTDIEIFKQFEDHLSKLDKSRIQIFDKTPPFPEYFNTVLRAKCTISPDTSTQHLAAVCNTPSLVFYPNERGYNHYAFEWPTAKCLNLTVPSAANLAGTVSLTCELLSVFLKLELSNKDYSRQKLGDNLENLITILEEIKTGAFIDDYSYVERFNAVLDLVEMSLPFKWRPILMPELRQTAVEIANKDKLLALGLRLVSDRISLIASVKIMSALASYSAERNSKSNLKTAFAANQPS